MSICLADIAFVMGLSCKTKYSDRTAGRNEMEKIFMLVDISRSCKSYCKKASKSFNNSRRLCSTFGRLYKRLFSWCLQCGVTYLQHIFVNLQVNRDRGRNRYNSHTITWFVFCLTFWGTLQGRWETWRCGRKCFQFPFQNLRKSASW